MRVKNVGRTFVQMGIVAISTAMITAIVISQSRAAPNTAAPTSAPSLAQQKLQTVKYATAFMAELNKQGMPPSLEDQCLWSRRLMEAEHDSAETDAARSTAVHDYLKRTQALETNAKAQYQVGALSYLNLMTVTYYRIEAEQLAAERG